MRAFDMSRYHRLIATEGRISGTFAVLGGKDHESDLWVKPHDVVIYDESRTFGTVLGRDDFAARVVKDSEGFGILVDIGQVRDRVEADVADVHGLMVDLLAMVARAYWGGVGTVIEQARVDAGMSSTTYPEETP